MDGRLFIHNIKCPNCGNACVKKQPWGNTGYDEFQYLITCSSLKCDLWTLVNEEQFERYNYIDKIDDYVEVSSRGK